jgi:hypothetical protein
MGCNDPWLPMQSFIEEKNSNKYGNILPGLPMQTLI